MSAGRQAKRVLRRLESDRWFGIDFSPLSPEEVLKALAKVPAGPCAASPSSLEALAEKASGCTNCALSKDRHKVVFGEGSPCARLVFVGEGPGADEDRQGRPFVGRAGKLLTKIISAMGLSREEVYITNVVKCRPPRNRAPLPEEALACRPYLDAQLAEIRPEILVALGASAAQAVLDRKGGISSLRGRFHDFGDIRVMPTFHPAYLLRSPEQKGKVWQDMKKVVAELGLELPQRR